MAAPADGDPGATGVRVAAGWMTGPAVAPVIAALGEGGVDVRFVGGCVRDALLRRPVDDIDIGVPLPPDEAGGRLEAAGLKVVPTGIAHGTVTAVSEGTAFEVTSLRRDVETDGRRAAIAYTADWREDALRRDFTMNALSLRPDGAVFDYFGGLADLDVPCIRFVGDPHERIREDHLRILRFYRFAARFGIAAGDPASRAACSAEAGRIETLSRERVGQEFLKTLAAPLAGEAVEAMASDGILDAVADTAWSPARFRSMAALEAALDLPPDPVRRLAALIGDSGRADAVGRSLRLSRKQADRLLAILQLAPGAAQDPDVAAEDAAQRPERLKAVRAAFYRHGAENWRDASLLAAASQDAADSGPLRDLVRAAAGWERPVLPVRGADLAARGIAGPAVGKGLKFVERWWIAQDFRPGREAALEKLEEAIALVRGMEDGRH